MSHVHRLRAAMCTGRGPVVAGSGTVLGSPSASRLSLSFEGRFLEPRCPDAVADRSKLKRLVCLQ